MSIGAPILSSAAAKLFRGKRGSDHETKEGGEKIPQLKKILSCGLHRRALVGGKKKGCSRAWKKKRRALQSLHVDAQSDSWDVVFWGKKGGGAIIKQRRE